MTNRRRQTTTDASKHTGPPTLCVGGPVIIYTLCGKTYAQLTNTVSWKWNTVNWQHISSLFIVQCSFDCHYTAKTAKQFLSHNISAITSNSLTLVFIFCQVSECIEAKYQSVIRSSAAARINTYTMTQQPQTFVYMTTINYADNFLLAQLNVERQKAGSNLLCMFRYL